MVEMRIFVLALALALIVGCSISGQVVKEDYVEIGAILPLSGTSAQYGEYIKEAIDLAVEEINSKRDSKLKILYEDSQCIPATAATAMNKLVYVNGVSVVLGDWCSSDVLAMAPIAEKSKTVILASAVSPKIRYAGDYVFRVQPDAFYYAEKLASSALVDDIGIILVNTDFGYGFVDEFERNFNGSVLVKEIVESDANDFRTELMKVSQYNVDALLYVNYNWLAVKQARELGLNFTIFGTPTMENEELIRIAGSAAEGVVYPYHFDPLSNNPLNVVYQEKYKAKYGRMSEGFAALMYDGVQIISLVLSVCGEDSTCIKDELYNLTYEGVTGLSKFDSFGDIRKEIVIKTVKNGSFVLY
ncbi:ABC transporter substrate-binding protein [Candidatus Woesearchaeota archaeon]|nr:ABC transporter substrate-binding protein [Candidatus Woesearchaeota archaeon]MBT3537482.1 ABC transporter substrate-binding protein [Candidatus Woesearchaeota archaeon]MBT4717607.1 ABC transporter substrate-binding protein [Candidatus Woesearchaeota archaeon]MBT7106208.1 ABC transporter substrate-binding protein [Candidatus Woesearchaeota archaeon]MBT7930894.1 ABC transporter substrate-binding protein [Candidatus Woesearchaeota archaeon]